MTIIKARVQENFCIIPNDTSQDKTLSFEATGLLVLLLSLPDDWVVHKSWVQEQKIKCGRDKLTGLFKELVTAGYVTKNPKQDEKGRMNGVDWIVYPSANLSNRTTENTALGKPTTTKNTSIQSKQDTNTNSVIDQLFEQFWLAGMVKVNKKKALTVFRAKIKASGQCEIFARDLILDVQARLSANQFGFDKMHPTTYLNGERWNDDIQTPVNQSVEEINSGDDWYKEMKL